MNAAMKKKSKKDIAVSTVKPIFLEDIPDGKPFADVLDSVVKEHGKEYAAASLLDRYDDRKEFLAEELMSSDLISTPKRTIRTIGLFLWKMTNNGVARVVSKHIPLLQEQGYNVVLITSEEDKASDFDIPDDVRWEIIYKPRPFTSEEYYKRAVDWGEVIKKNAIDIVIHHGASSIELLYDAIYLRLNKIPIIAMSHEMFSMHMVNNSGHRDYDKLAVYRLVNKIIVLSTTDESIYRSFGINAVYIPNPVDEVSEEITYHKKAKNVIWVGRIENNQKQCYDIVKIANRVRREVPDAQFKVLGRASSEAVESKMLDLIKKHDLEETIILEGFTHDLDKYYNEADVLLVTSRYEAFAMSIAESMSKGLPVVTYELPYMELFRSGKGFISVRQHDIEDAAKAVVSLLKDDDLRRELAEEALDEAKLFSNFDIGIRLKEIIENVWYDEEILENETLKTAVKTMLYFSSIADKRHQKLKEESAKLKEHKQAGGKGGCSLLRRLTLKGRKVFK